MRLRALNKHVAAVLRELPFSEAMARLQAEEPPKRLLKPLFSCLCSVEERVKWFAVSAMGRAVTALAGKELEDARVVMRRFMWMLNDESGGIGWGAPEAMAEVMSCEPRLASEYGHILVAFMREDGFFLELEPLQRGLMWGLGRMAEAGGDNLRLLLKHEADNYILPYLRSADAVVRGLAARAAGIFGRPAAQDYLQALRNDRAEFTLYDNGRFLPVSVGLLAAQALSPGGENYKL
ncbi:HEAT [hydrothermal vent metagenome]|uniref:HEAT n=1 Tax=hydrothermal vent metagenome TaxID=652676 RepID=A0A3B0UZ34_9ZZZZ